ncbi:5'-3' exonuclease family protein isoform X2 [Tasmannia lanceolata]|uniref:5'-3' exonuclease family protein isoform X2 n=1 Tax=Tasmannia lanceolata TaxID=3420 RepID=UPI004064021A
MGIQNLLRFMKPFVEPIHIQKYSGKRVGIDAYSWLHKGAYSCSMDLCLNPGNDASNRYIKYFMHRINLLRHHKITPVVVFDGGNIPCKSTTEEERQRKRNDSLALAREKLDQGDVSAAIEFFQRAVCITPSMAHQLIQLLRSERIEFVVAPYEADAQLAYLSNLEVEKGGIVAVITEDSDLMAYGCQAVIFKMDRYGNGEEILLDNVFNSVSGGLSFKYFDKELFTGMCVLAGCDFLPSVPGIGIKRAYSLVSKYRNLDRILSVLKYEKGRQMPEEYLKSFREAFAVFHHARIYDADTKTLKPMKPLSQKLLESLDDDLDFLGQEIPPAVAAAIAEGHMDPITMEAFDHFPKAKCHFDPVSTETFDRLPIAKPQVISMQHSCFTIFSAHETRVENITEMEQNSTSKDRTCSNEAVALAKLIAPSKLCQNLEVVEVEKREFPDNNPFKKRKMDNANSDFKESMFEQVSVVTDISKSDDILCTTPESQASVESKPTKRVKLISKGKNEKKLKSINNCKNSDSGSGIFKFFTRL